MTDDKSRGQRLKQEFIAARGFWIEAYEGLVELCPDFFDSHVKLSSVATKSDVLSPKMMELIAIAIDASTTHLYESGLRVHIRHALKLGATSAEIMEVFQLASGLGFQSVLAGLSRLRATSKGRKLLAARSDRKSSKRAAELKRRFMKTVGIWTKSHDEILKLSPDYFAAYLEFASIPWKSDVLSLKDKSLIWLAINSAVTHLYDTEINLSLKRAIDAGASAVEITHVLQRVSSLGMHTCMVGVPILLEELASTVPEKTASE